MPRIKQSNPVKRTVDRFWVAEQDDKIDQSTLGGFQDEEDEEDETEEESKPKPKPISWDGTWTQTDSSIFTPNININKRLDISRGEDNGKRTVIGCVETSGCVIIRNSVIGSTTGAKVTAGATVTASNETASNENVEWVLCDICAKWRRLPDYYRTESFNPLPDTWDCSMNTWDDSFNACRVPEEKLDLDVGEEVGIYETDENVIAIMSLTAAYHTVVHGQFPRSFLNNLKRVISSSQVSLKLLLVESSNSTLLCSQYSSSLSHIIKEPIVALVPVILVCIPTRINRGPCSSQEDASAVMDVDSSSQDDATLFDTRRTDEESSCTEPVFVHPSIIAWTLGDSVLWSGDSPSWIKESNLGSSVLTALTTSTTNSTVCNNAKETNEESDRCSFSLDERAFLDSMSRTSVRAMDRYKDKDIVPLREKLLAFGLVTKLRRYQLIGILWMYDKLKKSNSNDAHSISEVQTDFPTDDDSCNGWVRLPVISNLFYQYISEGQDASSSLTVPSLVTSTASTASDTSHSPSTSYVWYNLITNELRQFSADAVPSMQNCHPALVMPRGGILADEMGLGKTLQILGLVMLMKINRLANRSPQISHSSSHRNEGDFTDDTTMVIDTDRVTTTTTTASKNACSSSGGSSTGIDSEDESEDDGSPTKNKKRQRKSNRYDDKRNDENIASSSSTIPSLTKTMDASVSANACVCGRSSAKKSDLGWVQCSVCER